MHPVIAPYQSIFQKYNPSKDTSIAATDIDPSIEVFVTEVARHNNLVLLKDIIEKAKQNDTMKNYLEQWLRGATTAALLEKNSDMLVYLLETEMKVHDRSAGSLQLLRVLSLKEDLSDFDRIFNQVANHKWKLYPTSTLGNADFFFNLISRNEIQRVKQVCERYPLFVENDHVLNSGGVYACCYNSEDTLKYLLEQPYEIHNWTLWLMGSADAFVLSPNTICADMLLNAIPMCEEVDFFTQMVERLQRTEKKEYLPFLDVVLGHIVNLSLSDQKSLLHEMKFINSGVFVDQCCQVLESNILNHKISQNVSVSTQTKSKKM